MKLLFAIVAAALAGTVLFAQGGDVQQLRDRLRQRFDLAPLQDGVALIPRTPNRETRLVEVRDGIVSVNGDNVTARELRDRLGADADLVLRLTYLERDELRRVAAPDAAPAPATAPAPPSEPARDRIRRREITRVGGDVKVEANERVTGDVAAIMGSAQIDGEVTGDVVAVMGSVNLGPEAIVHGDVSAILGTVNRAAGARIDGAVSTVGPGDAGRRAEFRDALRRATFWRVTGLLGTLVRVALLILLTLVVAAFGQGMVGRIADRTASDVVRAGLVGLLAEIVFLPLLIITIVVLAISIIGIPLLVLVPFAILLALVMVLVGFTGVASHVGRTLQRRFGWGDGAGYGAVVMGVLAIVAVTLAARTMGLVAGNVLGFPLAAVGYLIEYLAWTIGVGAMLLTWREMRHPQVVPPPLP